MSKYAHRWTWRPEKVDCRICGGDIHDRERGSPTLILPREAATVCCAGTGLDEIPWSELFKKGRRYGT